MADIPKSKTKREQKIRRLVATPDSTIISLNVPEDVYECPGDCDTLVVKFPGPKKNVPAKFVIKL